MFDFLTLTIIKSKKGDDLKETNTEIYFELCILLLSNILICEKKIFIVK
jgi:hypothetical protein